jgi:hypothetical protein
LVSICEGQKWRTSDSKVHIIIIYPTSLIMEGFSSRNVRRIVSKRVRENLQYIATTSKKKLTYDSQIELTTPSCVDIELQSNTSDSSDVSSFSNCELSSSESSLKPVEMLDLKEDLKSWAVTHNITGIAINDLLKTLGKYEALNHLPKDHRSLLNTKQCSTIRSISGGNYTHIGLEKNLRKQLSEGFIEFQDGDNLSLTVSLSFDGLPISRSSNSQFWPIQGICNQSKFGVFVIGIFHGKTKPTNVEEFLQELVMELSHLGTNGFEYGLSSVFIKVASVIADAPARSFIKQCKGHNSYSGCERCIDHGEWSGRVILTNSNCDLRTDATFISQLDKNHHIGISPLLEIGIPLVSSFVLDYMHLVCLGVVKKILKCWVKGPIPYKLSNQNIQLLSEKLLIYRLECPKDFCRKPRSLKEIDLWKATEFRAFLLYTGPVVLKNFLPKDKYQHFVSLSMALRILLSDKASDPEWNTYSKSLLRDFVAKVPSLYSRDFMTYNMHSLIHSSDDALKYGSLEKINAFPFENNMQIIKRSLRASFKPLEQAVRRISERQQLPLKTSEGLSFIIDRSRGNNCYRLKCGTFVLIKGFEGKVNLNCKKFLRINDFFNFPCKSSIFGIVRVAKLSEMLNINRSDIQCKCWLFPEINSGSFIVIPLLNWNK